MSCYRISARNAGIGSVLRWCQVTHQVDRMLVAVRQERWRGSWRPISPKQHSTTLELFGEFVISETLCSWWPGTMTEGAGLVFLIHFNDSVRKIASRVGPRLVAWERGQNPPLPEDICLFKLGASRPVLLSVTHEGDAWLLTNKRVGIAHVSKAEHELDDIMLSFCRAKLFCRRWRGRK